MQTFTPIGSAIGFFDWRQSRMSATTRSHRLSRRERQWKRKGRRALPLYGSSAERVDLRLLNTRVLESLIKAGAMDTFGGRAQVTSALDKAMERAQKSQRDAAAGQHGLFGIFDDGPANSTSSKEDASSQRAGVGRAHPATA